jgi:hypothetical protein
VIGAMVKGNDEYMRKIPGVIYRSDIFLSGVEAWEIYTVLTQSGDDTSGHHFLGTLSGRTITSPRRSSKIKPRLLITSRSKGKGRRDKLDFLRRFGSIRSKHDGWGFPHAINLSWKIVLNFRVKRNRWLGGVNWPPRLWFVAFY